MEIRKEQKHITSNSLTSTPATVQQHRIALIISVLLAPVALLTLLYARQMFPHIPAFIAFYYALALFTNLITAYFFFGLFFPILIILLSIVAIESNSILPILIVNCFHTSGRAFGTFRTCNSLCVGNRRLLD